MKPLKIASALPSSKAAAVAPVPSNFPAAEQQAHELWLAVHFPSGNIPQGLAVRAQHFTPRVSLAPPDGLLLEVKGSLRLFGGAEALCRAVAADHRALEVKSVCALAPTPLAALVLARAGDPCIVTDSARLTSRLVRLPLAVLRWPVEAVRRLAKAGVYTIGQVLRLPRAGFARRFGAAQLAALDRLVGRAADLQAPFEPCERFRRRGEFTFEIENQTLILKVIEPLLQELEGFLRARGSGILRLECRLHHRQAPPTRCVLKLATPAADARRLGKLLGERLTAIALPEPVRACELRTDRIVPRTPDAQTLWRAGEHGGRAGAESPGLIEHLRARLGTEAVYGLGPVQEHRPETAWRVLEPGTKGHSVILERRPLWLLAAPQRLLEKPLRILSGPERIETGWWNGADIARDYYTAVDAQGARLWVFRELKPPRQWFLHGLFG